jgi:hypothetical protein
MEEAVPVRAEVAISSDQFIISVSFLKIILEYRIGQQFWRHNLSFA